MVAGEVAGAAVRGVERGVGSAVQGLLTGNPIADSINISVKLAEAAVDATAGFIKSKLK